VHADLAVIEDSDLENVKLLDKFIKSVLNR
jgi:hypothetical protein